MENDAFSQYYWENLSPGAAAGGSEGKGRVA
jgi:hypothetical protein